MIYFVVIQNDAWNLLKKCYSTSWNERKTDFCRLHNKLQFFICCYIWLEINQYLCNFINKTLIFHPQTAVYRGISHHTSDVPFSPLLMPPDTYSIGLSPTRTTFAFWTSTLYLLTSEQPAISKILKVDDHSGIFIIHMLLHICSRLWLCKNTSFFSL